MAGSAAADPVSIVAFGDSLTAGYGLPPDQGFVPVMQKWLDEHGADVRLVNAGVSGDTTAGGLARIDWTLADDMDAMIVALGGNDYLRGFDPAMTRNNLDGILTAAQAKGIKLLLVGIAVGSNYGPEYKQNFDNIFTDLAEKHDIPLYPDWYEGLHAAAGPDGQIAAYLQGDGIHPDAEAVPLIVAAIGPAVLSLAESVE